MNVFFSHRKFRTDKEEIDYIVDIIAEPFIKDLQYQTIEQVKNEPAIERKTIARNSIAEGKIPKRQTISSRKVVNEEEKQITSDCNKIKDEVENRKISSTNEHSEISGQNANKKKNTEFKNMENLNELLNTKECSPQTENQNMNLIQNERKIEGEKNIDLNLFTSDLEETNNDINCVDTIKTPIESVTNEKLKKKSQNLRRNEPLENNSKETDEKDLIIEEKSHLDFNKNEQTLTLEFPLETIKDNSKDSKPLLCKNQDFNDQVANSTTEESANNLKFIKNKQNVEKNAEKSNSYIFRNIISIIFRPRIFIRVAFIVSALFLTKYMKSTLKIGKIKIN